MKRNTIQILGIPIDNVDYTSALDMLEHFMDKGGHHLVVTPNPEMIMMAQKNTQIKEILCSAALSAPDGIGVVLASRLTNNPIPNRVTGCDLMLGLLERMSKSGRTAYFLGAKPGVVELAKQNMEIRFPNLKVVGTYHGYFTSSDDKLIRNELIEKKPDLLMLGLSMEMALKWAQSHQDLNIPVIACIGGTLDVMSGTTKRAPAIFQKLGLEWFYRLIKEPRRAGRMLKLPIFAIKVLRERKKKETNSINAQ